MSVRSSEYVELRSGELSTRVELSVCVFLPAKFQSKAFLAGSTLSATPASSARAMATCLAVNPAPSLRIVSALDFPNNGLQDEFVRRNGSQLFLGSARFFSVGPNAYWLGLDEEIARPKYAFPRQQQVLEVMATVRAMGGSTFHDFGPVADFDDFRCSC